MVAIVWMSTCWLSGSCCGVHSLCDYLYSCCVVSSLATIQAQWITSSAILWSVVYAKPSMDYLEDVACSIKLKWISLVWGEL